MLCCISFEISRQKTKQTATAIECELICILFSIRPPSTTNTHTESGEYDNICRRETRTDAFLGWWWWLSWWCTRTPWVYRFKCITLVLFADLTSCRCCRRRQETDSDPVLNKGISVSCASPSRLHSQGTNGEAPGFVILNKSSSLSAQTVLVTWFCSLLAAVLNKSLWFDSRALLANHWD